MDLGLLDKWLPLISPRTNQTHAKIQEQIMLILSGCHRLGIGPFEQICSQLVPASNLWHGRTTRCSSESRIWLHQPFCNIHIGVASREIGPVYLANGFAKKLKTQKSLHNGDSRTSSNEGVFSLSGRHPEYLTSIQAPSGKH